MKVVFTKYMRISRITITFCRSFTTYPDIPSRSIIVTGTTPSTNMCLSLNFAEFNMSISEEYCIHENAIEKVSKVHRFV